MSYNCVTPTELMNIEKSHRRGIKKIYVFYFKSQVTTQREFDTLYAYARILEYWVETERGIKKDALGGVLLKFSLTPRRKILKSYPINMLEIDGTSEKEYKGKKYYESQTILRREFKPEMDKMIADGEPYLDWKEYLL